MWDTVLAKLDHLTDRGPTGKETQLFRLRILQLPPSAPIIKLSIHNAIAPLKIKSTTVTHICMTRPEDEIENKEDVCGV